MFINRGFVASGSLLLPSGIIAATFITLEFLGNFEDGGSATTYNFASCDYGAEDADRYIFAAAGRGGSASQTISSATLNGVAASIPITVGANLSSTGIAFAKVPTGLTGLTTSITWSGSASGCGLALYRGVATGRTISFDDSAQTTLDNTIIEANVAAGGIALWLTANRSGTAGTPTGFTLDVDAVTTSGAGTYYVGQYEAGDIAAETDRDFKLDGAGDRFNSIVATFKMD
jgi:hypothetical protein